MINSLDHAKISPKTREVILDECSKYGVFSDSERDDCVDMLRRVGRSSGVDKIKGVLELETANADWVSFNRLVVRLCCEKRLYTVLEAVTKNFEIPQDLVQESKCGYLNLLSDLRSTVEYLEDSVLKKHVFEISKLLSEGDLDCFYAQNPIFFIFHLFLDKDVDVFDTFLHKKEFDSGNFRVSKKLIENVLRGLPSLSSLIGRKVSSLTIYDLLEFHLKLDVEKVFGFRKRESPIPSFCSEDLVERFGYTKKLNFIFHLKQSRPSVACRVYFEQGDSPKRKAKTEKKVRKLVASKFFDTSVASGCVAFLEMIGDNSEKLRVLVSVANTIVESELLSENNVSELLLTNPVALSDVFENVLISQLNFEDLDLFSIIKLMNVSTKFCLLHNVELPEKLLTHFATKNLWLLFLVISQIYSYPLSQIQKLSQHFRNPTIMEHVLHGITHDIHIDDAKSLIMRDRDARKYYLSKIGVRQSVDGSASESSSGSLRSFSSTASSAGSCDGLEYDAVGSKVDLLQTLIRCHNSVDPPKALLQACCLYSYPLFAVLATCYEVS